MRKRRGVLGQRRSNVKNGRSDPSLRCRVIQFSVLYPRSARLNAENAKQVKKRLRIINERLYGGCALRNDLRIEFDVFFFFF